MLEGMSTARKVKTSDEVSCFSIEGKLTASMVDELREAILPVIVRLQAIEIDLSRVSEIDLAGLRLMVDVRFEALARQEAALHQVE